MNLHTLKRISLLSRIALISTRKYYAISLQILNALSRSMSLSFFDYFLTLDVVFHYRRSDSGFVGIRVEQKGFVWCNHKVHRCHKNRVVQKQTTTHKNITRKNHIVWMLPIVNQRVSEGRDSVSEWLRRWTRNPLGSARRGSNPLGVVFLHVFW